MTHPQVIPAKAGRADIINSAHHLLSGHTNGLDGEFSATHIEQIFQVGPEKVDDENIMQSFLSKMVYLRNTGYISIERRGKRSTLESEPAPLENN